MRAVEAKCQIDAAPNMVLPEFVNVESMKKWWGADRGFIEAKEGGVWFVAWTDLESGFKYVSSGIVSKYDPNQIVEISNFVNLNPDYPVFGPMTLTFTAKAVDGGCELQVRQSGYQEGEAWDWYHDAVTEAWPEVLKTFKTYVESKKALV